MGIFKVTSLWLVDSGVGVRRKARAHGEFGSRTVSVPQFANTDKRVTAQPCVDSECE